MVRRRGWGVALVAVLGSALGGLAPEVGAQSREAQSREALLLPVPQRPSALGGRFGTASPGVSASSPLAFGPSYRDAFFGVGVQATTRYGGGVDGAASGGFGVGNAQRLVALEVVVTSLSTVRSGLFDRTAAALKVHRRLPGNAAVAVGVEGIKVTGTNFETTESVYAAVSKVAVLRGSGDPRQPFSSATVNVGVGNGRFCAEQAIRTGGTTTYGLADCVANVFASVGLRASDWAGLVADWTGQDLNLGVSLAPFPALPLVVTPALADLTGRAGDGARFTVGAGFGLRF
jgi:hypothetical protein